VLAGTANDELIGRHCPCSVPGCPYIDHPFYPLVTCPASDGAFDA